MPRIVFFGRKKKKNPREKLPANWKQCRATEHTAQIAPDTMVLLFLIKNPRQTVKIWKTISFFSLCLIQSSHF
jgi:hypothetical protein